MAKKTVKINFKKVVAPLDFEGHTQAFDTCKFVGNTMKFSGSVLLDIGFEDLAKKIYYSADELIEIPAEYIDGLKSAIIQSSMIATIKRELINQINEQQK